MITTDSVENLCERARVGKPVRVLLTGSGGAELEVYESWVDQSGSICFSVSFPAVEERSVVGAAVSRTEHR